MRVLSTVSSMRDAMKTARRDSPGKIVGLVPTMGALHEGHLSLVREARASCDCVVTTIFVNPLQFGPHEDLGKYPRTFERDCEMLSAEGVDVVFAPTVEEMYPAGAATVVDVPEIGSRLDGASRPGHFRGVATIVTKLFHIVQPHRAFFGQKDAAQVAVLRPMVRDLNFDLELITCPIVREADGLAMSSRNRYLSASERSQALALHAALTEVENEFKRGNRDVTSLRSVLRERLERAPGVRMDYAEIVDQHTLGPVSDSRAGALVAVAAWVGETRLIDNILLPGEGTTR
ncbi:MAG TPA: pantoate--beta-alanine ligase [Acidobacteriaceae bacterium]|nr:pantoate--beta-alanine ligase [Acidobacteriaceae bacterium]